MNRNDFGEHTFCCCWQTEMHAEMVVKLIEEMVDIKVQQQGELHLHAKPELARLLAEKRYADNRRLEMIKHELARLFGQPVVKIVERK